MRRLYRYEIVNGEFVEKTSRESQANRAHSIITDSMPDTWHPLTGEYMDSKSRFRQVTRAHGYTEVGNESLIPKRQEESSDKFIERAYREAKEELGF